MNEVWDLDSPIKPTLDAMEGVFGQRSWRGIPPAGPMTGLIDWNQASVFCASLKYLWGPRTCPLAVHAVTHPRWPYLQELAGRSSRAGRA